MDWSIIIYPSYNLSVVTTVRRVLRSLKMELATVSKHQNKIDNMNISEKHINNSTLLFFFKFKLLKVKVYYYFCDFVYIVFSIKPSQILKHIMV